MTRDVAYQLRDAEELQDLVENFDGLTRERRAFIVEFLGSLDPEGHERICLTIGEGNPQEAPFYLACFKYLTAASQSKTHNKSPVPGDAGSKRNP